MKIDVQKIFDKIILLRYFIIGGDKNYYWLGGYFGNKIIYFGLLNILFM
jgi:hypothetical protein